MISCFYLMAQEHHSNWLRFLIWLGLGLVIYFLYSRRHSKLNPANAALKQPPDTSGISSGISSK